MDRLIVLSPHYDDAVLSTGQLLIGHHNPTVVTVCSGAPDYLHFLTEYDKNCGFTETKEVLPAREAENEAACRIVGASAEGLGLVDGQYRGERDQKEFNETIHEYVKSLDRKDTIVAPLATKHPDHEKTMWAALTACERLKRTLWLYEELPHRVLWPEEVMNTMDALHAVDINLEKDFLGDGMMELKIAAVNCYKSQLWSLDQRCIYVPERLHRVIF